MRRVVPRLWVTVVLFSFLSAVLVGAAISVGTRYPFSDLCPRGYPSRLETSVGGSFFATVEVNQSDVESLSHVLLLNFEPLGFSKSAVIVMTWERNGVLPTSASSPLLDSSVNIFTDTTDFPFVLRNATSTVSQLDTIYTIDTNGSSIDTNGASISTNNDSAVTAESVTGHGAGVFTFGGQVLSCPSCVAQRFDLVFTPRLFAVEASRLQARASALLDDIIVPSSEMARFTRLSLVQALFETGTQQPFWVVPDRYTSVYETANNTASSPPASVFLDTVDAPNIGLYFHLQALDTAERDQIVRLFLFQTSSLDTDTVVSAERVEPKKPLLNSWVSTQPVFLSAGTWLITPRCVSSDVSFAADFDAFLNNAEAAAIASLKHQNITSVSFTNRSALLTREQLAGSTFRPRQSACRFRFAVGVNAPPPVPSSAPCSFSATCSFSTQPLISVCLTLSFFTSFFAFSF